MGTPKKRFKVLFFVPHCDDLEFGAPLACIEFLKAGFDVVQVLMTCCEYGTNNVAFKGTRLKNIRRIELNRATEVYKITGNHVRIIRMGYLDGNLPLSNNSLKRVINLISEEKPDIIFTPDPWYSVDMHVDHINTGRLPYLAIKYLDKSVLPKYFYFYYSFKNNFALKCQMKDLSIFREALSKHKSQVSSRSAQNMTFLRRLLLIWRFFRNSGVSQAFREVKIIEGKPEPHKPITSLRDKIIGQVEIVIFRHVTIRSLQPVSR